MEQTAQTAAEEQNPYLPPDSRNVVTKSPDESGRFTLFRGLLLAVVVGFVIGIGLRIAVDTYPHFRDYVEIVGSTLQLLSSVAICSWSARSGNGRWASTLAICGAIWLPLAVGWTIADGEIIKDMWIGTLAVATVSATMSLVLQRVHRRFRSSTASE